MVKSIEEELEIMLDTLEEYTAAMSNTDASAVEKQRAIRGKKRALERLGNAISSAAKTAVDKRTAYEVSALLREKADKAIESMSGRADSATEAMNRKAAIMLSETIRDFDEKSNAFLRKAEKITAEADAQKLIEALEKNQREAKQSVTEVESRIKSAKDELDRIIAVERRKMEATAKAGQYGIALQGALEIIKAQGVELSEDSVVEVVKAVTEYQCKVVEAQSYKDWIETKTEGQRGR